MNSDKKTFYVLSLSFLAVLLSCFFIDVDYKQYILLGLVVVFALITLRLVKKRSILSVNKNQVTFLISVIALLYLMAYYLSGLHFGFHKTYNNVWDSLLKVTVLVVTVICTEYIRSVYIQQNVKGAWVVVYAICVLINLIPNFSSNLFRTSYEFMDFIGLALFPALVFNFLFNYLSKRYGALPSIAYIIIVKSIPLFLPVASSIPSSLLSFVELIMPILIWAFINALYEKKKREKHRVGLVVTNVITGVLIVFMITVIALISCQFRYRAIVIATESMTGEINKGDVIVYERYDNQTIEENQILVFDNDGTTTVHRVVKIEIINGEYRYTTKGDANENVDKGYITNADIEGIVHFKVAYVGYPTIWLKEAFNK